MLPQADRQVGAGTESATRTSRLTTAYVLGRGACFGRPGCKARTSAPTAAGPVRQLQIPWKRHQACSQLVPAKPTACAGNTAHLRGRAENIGSGPTIIPKPCQCPAARRLAVMLSQLEPSNCKEPSPAPWLCCSGERVACLNPCLHGHWLARRRGPPNTPLRAGTRRGVITAVVPWHSKT